MRLNVEDGLPVELAGCDEEQTPNPEQIHNLHEILLQKHIVLFAALRLHTLAHLINMLSIALGCCNRRLLD